MTALLVALLVVLFGPLLSGSWRASLAGLGLQGLLMTALVAHRGWPDTASGVVLLVDLLLVRGWLAPRHLARVMRGLSAPARSDVIPANLLSWALAGGAVVLAFRFAGAVEPLGGARALHVAVSAAALLLGLLVLATQTSRFGQVIGVLRVEYAIALFELGAEHEPALPVQLGLTAVLVLSVLLLGAFLGKLGAGDEAAPAAGDGDAAGAEATPEDAR